MSTHDFVEVRNRRWCLNCDLFQHKGRGAAYFPKPPIPCPRDTKRAKDQDADIDHRALSNGLDTVMPDGTRVHGEEEPR